MVLLQTIAQSVSSMRELTYNTLDLIDRETIYIAGNKVVSIGKGWNITEVTIGSDNDGTRRRLIITVDRD